MSKLTFQSAAAAALILAAGSANALLIDSFTTDQSLQITNVSGRDLNSDVTNPPGSFLGTNRNLRITNNASLMQTYINESEPGALDVSNNSSSNGTVYISWTGIGGQDLTDGGQSKGFYLGIPSEIDNPMRIAFNVDGSTFFLDFPDNAVGDDFFFPFASFSNPGVFTSVNSIIMTVSSTQSGWDASVEFVETRPVPVPVPVPGTLALLGLGLAGLGARRFKRA